MGNGSSGGIPLPGSVTIGRGQPNPCGCSEAKGGGAVNFSLDAPTSGSVWLEITLPEGHPGLAAVGASGPARSCIKLDPANNKSGDTWHIELTPPFPSKGATYMWLLDPQIDPATQLPTDAAWRIIDPCAKALDSTTVHKWNFRGGPKYSPKAVVPDYRAVQDFDWQGVQPPGMHLKDLIIYEAHVRGFTRNPDSKVSDFSERAGTFLGLIEKIPHLLKLGVNAIELLPVFEFDETACPRKNPLNGEQLCNYWGYSTVNFMVPMQRFASVDQPGAAIVAFKTMVRELHRQGIEVLLDVVFNHTAEGTWGENFWHSMAAIAKPRYYLLSKGCDTNYTGCGNTVNSNDPLCSDWIVNCLRFWVEEMHVDGFRFDLASCLTRGGDGKVQTDPMVIRKMCSDPVLSRAKLIAEPWDCSWPDGYLVGKFPSCGPPRFAEWNGIFRDTVRKFIKGDEGTKGDFATRVCGSSDLFRHNGRGPFHSVNFITAHDGFTLRDLVSYNGKQNHCNGEESGDDHNNSWNCGAEGETGDGGIQHLRNKQIKNFMCAMMLSVGTPMITYGDEYGRSQKGCNNGWCQDAISWFSWSDAEKEENKLMRFTRLLIAIRKTYSRIFCRQQFVGDKDIWWRTHWDDPYNYICWVLHDNQGDKGYSGLLIAFNAGNQYRNCDLPTDRTWHRLVDTNLGAPDDIAESEQAAVKISGSSYSMAPYSCIVLKTFSSAGSGEDFGASDTAFRRGQSLIDHLESVVKRRMSMEFTSVMAPMASQRDLMMSMSRRRSMMSGTIVSVAGEDGAESFAFESLKEEPTPMPAPAPALAPPMRAPSAHAPLAPAPSAPARASSAVGAIVELPAGAEQLLSAELGGSRRIQVHMSANEGGRVVSVSVAGFTEDGLLLHWGAIEAYGGGWKHPPASVLSASSPSASQAIPGAVQTCFSAPQADGLRRVLLPFAGYTPKSLNFVLHAPPNQWIKKGNDNFTVPFPTSEREFEASISRVIGLLPPDMTQRSQTWKVLDFSLSVNAAVGLGGCVAHFVANTDAEMMLHYGPGDSTLRWLTARSANFSKAAEQGVQEIRVTLDVEEVSANLMFVLKLGANHWVKNGARDFVLPLPEDARAACAKTERAIRKEEQRAEVRKTVEEVHSNMATSLEHFRGSRAARQKAGDVSFATFTLAEEAGEIDVLCSKAAGGKFRVEVSACLNPQAAPGARTLLHWGAILDVRRTRLLLQ